MGYPNTRPIRPLTASEEAGEHRAHTKQGREPDGAPPDFASDLAKGSPIYVAALRKFARHCGTCGVVFLIALAWMLGLVPQFESPFARAGEVKTLKQVVSEMYLLQLSSSIRAYQESLCQRNDSFLQDELERAQIRYYQHTGTRYPNVGCKVTSTKGQ